ncbi:MAG: ParB N-terminal domain-containing protein [Bacilli bacterium]|nr:ParB N-terminal domain-containing protein [Bacilli bacterium]
MQIVNKNITEIKEYENNPRNNDGAVEYVANSIKEFGFKVPIVIDKNNVIVAGHTRYKASKLLGITEIPCIIADDLTEEQIKAYRLVDNKSAEYATWDMALLNMELESLQDFDMELFDFDIEKDLKEVVDDDYEIELPEEPKTKYGDIYKLGNHYLMCGDSTNKDDVDKLMNNEFADLVVTDPPYNVNYEGKTEDNLKIMNDNMDNDKFYSFLKQAYDNLYSHTRDGGSIYVFHADTEGLNFRKAFSESGYKLAECLVWVKNSFVMGRQDYQWKHEPILYGWKLGASHYFVGDRNLSTVLEFDKPNRNAEHPTMKPVELVAYLIRNSSQKNNIILDLFGGSGSTLIACEQLERKAFLMELDERYCDVIIDRWEKFTNQKAELINGE